ncbi:pentatricopeptide repeat-containing protein At4g16835, mitochondrial-like [Zingiber officinale]|uniref:pentatricopeptide repeat-containing protein At4g16835, mitochondrial-like n=1 Tax=Zingiber officinale TaxID=94328 RepID=UPI001C4C7140|nr:pentatricopeptide repeat-containing protein At4g16835, mitochondrial-like [Zingiber officinale]
MAMRNLVSWNALIVGIVYNKLYYDEMEAFRSVLNDDGLLTPNQVSLSNMLSTCSNVCSIGFWRVVHDLAVKLTVESSLAYVRNSLIDMYCKLIKLFDEMMDLGIDPNCITFVSVLSYCNHNELVDQGFKYYTCMVDLLGRAGHLDEAMQFIDAMPIHPDSSVWGALLAACRKFKNLELSSKVVQNLFMIELHNFGNYVCIAWNVGRS